ncbi:hypothetical protein [Putridiphycobacter roseus]|nr:hypothetical protein [Putridiphycobacter roseus]
MAKKHSKSQAKEISEKTFELNITTELLNISKSFIWYMDHSPLSHFLDETIWREFLNQSVFFAEGLTQDQESKVGGGYDVSIHCKHPISGSGRLMFLQYKAGKRVGYCQNKESHFNKDNSISSGSEHAMFTFNDAAKKRQHSILQELAKNNNIQAESVMYVFPRITETIDFYDKVGNLIENSSFVPVLDLDEQAKKQSPAITINEGVVHKYRTSYDGLKSEVNFFFFKYIYTNYHLQKLLGEMICVQLERFFKILKKRREFRNDKFQFEIIRILEHAIFNSITSYFKTNITEFVLDDIRFYLRKIEQYFSYDTIPNAPSTYTTIVPKQGLKLELQEFENYSSINYQIF